MRLTPALASALILTLSLAACGDDEPSAPATSAGTPSASATAETPPAADELLVAPGRIGQARVGMSKSEALATGLFDADVPVDGEVCEGVDHLRWKSFPDLDVLTDDQGRIVSLGVMTADVPTTEGVGVTSTYAEVVEAYGPELSDPAAAGFDQVGAYVRDGDRWLGFLFGEAESVEQALGDTSTPVTFLEVTVGEKPALIRDGC